MTPPFSKSESSITPQSETAIAAAVFIPMRVPKKAAIIAAVKTGYRKRIAEAIPAGMRVKLQKSACDENAKSAPSITSSPASARVVRKPPPNIATIGASSSAAAENLKNSMESTPYPPRKSGTAKSGFVP